MSDARPIITAPEYATALGVSLKTVQSWLRDDLLPGAYKSPQTERGTWLIPAGCPAPVRNPVGRPRRA